MLPFVAAGGAAGTLSYFFGLPVAYAVFLAVAVVGVLVGINSALTVKVPAVEPKPKKVKPEKPGRRAAPNSADTEVTEKPQEQPKTEPKATSNKREKERAKKAAKKEAEEKQAAEAARAAEAAAKAEKERLEAEAASKRAEEEENAKKKKKKKKKTEEKEAPAAAAPAATEKKAAPAKKAEPAPSKTAETIESVERKIESKMENKEPQDVWEDVKGKKGKREIPEVTSTTAAATAVTEFKAEIDVSPKNFPVIVGQKGATLKLITDATHTSIDCKKDEGKVIVAGQSRESVNKAIEAIRQLNHQGWSDLTHSCISLPANKRFNVIGQGGQTVKLIQDKLNVKIKLPEKETDDTTVTVTGDSPSDVRQALNCLQDLIDKGFSSLTHPDCVSDSIEAPGQLGRVMGSGGATIREIQNSTGAKVNVDGTSLIIVGQPAQVAEAKAKILQLIAPAEVLPTDPAWSQEVSMRNVDLW